MIIYLQHLVLSTHKLPIIIIFFLHFKEKIYKRAIFMECESKVSLLEHICGQLLWAIGKYVIIILLLRLPLSIRPLNSCFAFEKFP